MKIWQHFLLGIFCGLLLTGVILLFLLPQRGEPIQLVTLTPDMTPKPTPTEAVIQVQIVGAVNHPGVYSLSAGSRIQDAIEAAGGFNPEAQPDCLNLTAFLNDGQRLYVPSITEGIITPQESKNTEVELNTPSGLVNINTADINLLMTLPGIGQSKAGEIINYRNQHGAFQSIDDLVNVSGIGPTTMEEIYTLITIGP